MAASCPLAAFLLRTYLAAAAACPWPAAFPLAVPWASPFVGAVPSCPLVAMERINGYCNSDQTFIDCTTVTGDGVHVCSTVLPSHFCPEKYIL